MYKKMFFLIITVLTTQVLFAQNSNLEIQLSKHPNTQANYELKIQVRFAGQIESGLLIELPASIKVVPSAIELNNNPLWLKNISSIPDSDSVVNWELIPDGLILRFKDNLLKVNDLLNVTCISHILKMPDDSSQIIIKNITQQTDGTIQLGETIISNNFPKIVQDNN